MADTELTGSPSMLPLFARAGLSLVPGVSRLPFVGGGGGDVPDRTLVRPDVVVDRNRLAAYDRVCGFDLSDVLPPTYPHMLAFPMHLALMTGGDFPLPAIGLVHIANRITVHRPIRATELLSLRVWATPLQAHPRGRRFDIRTEVRVGDELVWEEASTNLSRGNGSDGASTPTPTSTSTPTSTPPSTPTPAPADPPSSDELPAVATWRLPGDLGRRYGAVSGDLNPIHLHPLSARLFGFPTAIAHGMWTMARCLAALGPELPVACEVDVAFKKPILLPATVRLAEGLAVGGLGFGVRDAELGTPHLDGRVSSAVPQGPTPTPSRPRRRA